MSYIGNTPGVSSQRVVLEELIAGAPKSVFTPTAGYIKGYVDVLVNGHELDSIDFTALDGVTVSLVVAAAIGDTVKIKTWLPRGLSDGYLKTEADARFAALGVAYTKAEADAKYPTKAAPSFTGTAAFDATAATWWASGKQLQLGAGTALWDYNAAGNSQARLFNNLYLDASGSARYLTANAGSYYQQYNGAHAWGQAPVGVAGAAATTVDSMSLDSAGNLKFNSGFGSAGPAYGCRAWATYAGFSGYLLAVGNISSAVKNAAGDYTFNFITAMPDTSYCAVAMGSDLSNGAPVGQYALHITTLATTYVRVKNNYVVNNSGYSLADADRICLTITR